MQTRIKAVLLSALVLPGIGQLYKGERLKGGIFLILVNVFLLSALFLVMKGMGSFLLTARISGTDEALKVLDGIRKSSPHIGWLLNGFFFLWIAAVVDAAVAPGKSNKELSP